MKKDTIDHQGKANLKPSHPLGCLESKSLLTSVGEDVKKLQPSYTAGGNRKQ